MKLREIIRGEAEFFLAVGITVLWAIGGVAFIYFLRWTGLI